MDLLTGENWSFIYLAKIILIYWSVRVSSRKGGDELDGGFHYFSQVQA